MKLANENGIGALRLLWLTENYPPSQGGMAQSCDRIVRSLRQGGTTIDVAHFSNRVHNEKVETQYNGRCITWPLGEDAAHGLNCFWNWLSRDAKQTPHTHVVAFGGIVPLLASPVISAWLKVPLITLMRGNDFDVAIFSPKRSDLVHEALSRSTAVCVVSRDKAEKISALYPTLRTEWVPNGIELSEWHPLPSNLKKAEAWRAANVPAGKRVLGMFGQIKQKKGGLFFLQMLLASGYADKFHVLFVGEVGTDIVQWLQTSGQSISCSFLPFVDRYELLSYYPACDFVVIASFYDGLPNVLMEATALGIPLIASTAGGMNDFLTDNKHGFLFYPGDEHECRYAIERAATAPSQVMDALQQNCRELASKKFDANTEANSYRRILVETLNSTPPTINTFNSHETSLPRTASLPFNGRH